MKSLTVVRETRKLFHPDVMSTSPLYWTSASPKSNPPIGWKCRHLSSDWVIRKWSYLSTMLLHSDCPIRREMTSFVGNGISKTLDIVWGRFHTHVHKMITVASDTLNLIHSSPFLNYSYRAFQRSNQPSRSIDRHRPQICFSIGCNWRHLSSGWAIKNTYAYIPDKFGHVFLP